MSIDYSTEALSLSKYRIEQIKKYYLSWKGNYDINLKFRFLKSFVIDLNTNRTKWLLLHRWANKRRIQNHELPLLINQMINQNIIPIRLFHSVCEWLAPHEIDRNEYLWVIKTNIVPIETDATLEISLETARQVGNSINGDRYYVFSGNKSVHVWWLDFDYQKFLRKTELYKVRSARSREKYDRLARKRFILDIQRGVESEIDERNAIDTKRVIPIIGSLNGFTGRKVLRIDESMIRQISTSDLLAISEI